MENESNNLMSMDNTGGDDQGSAAAYTPPPAPKAGGLFSRSNLLLVGLFGAALLGLYMIHVHAGANEASAASKDAESKMDTFLMTLQDLKKQSTKKVSVALDTTRFEASHRQVPLTDLRLNPFRYKPIELAGLSPEATTQSSSAPGTASVDAELQNAMAKVRELKLQSILSGREPAALIDNNMVGIGQKIAGWTVVEIKPQSVKLKWRELTHTLYLD